MTILLMPFLLLNMLGGIIAGVWLALLGEWPLVIWGIALSIVGTFIVSILLMPGMLIMGLVGAVASGTRAQKSPLVMAFLTVLGVGYTYFIMGIWAHAIFRFFVYSVHSNGAAIPILLWSYAASTAVWNYMAQLDARSGNEYTPISAVFHQIACVCLMIYGFASFPYLKMEPMILWYVIPMGIGLLIQVTMVVSTSMEQRRRGY